MQQYIARIFFALQLVIIISFTTYAEEHGDDYAEEDRDYESYFYGSDDANIWEYDSRDPINFGPVRLKGGLRKNFALNILTTDPERTMICSPVAVMLSLGKLALGAEGECLTQLLNVLGLEKKAELKSGIKPLIVKLEVLQGVYLKIISKVFVSKDMSVRSNFKSRAKKIFGSAVSSVDFNKPAALVRGINEYVKLMTRGQIENTISEHDIPSSKSSVLLVNAVYFTGYWEREFKVIEPTEFLSSHAVKQVIMMSRRDTLNYGKNALLDCQLIEIPYAGGQTSLLIILPNKKNNLPVLLDKISRSPHLIQQAMEKMEPKDIVVTIPKFKSEIKMNLNDNFKQLGLTKIFQKKHSGLDGIVKEGSVHVSKTIHRVIIDVTDLCSGNITSTNGHIHPIPRESEDRVFNANHPFLYFVLFKHEQLFAGTFAG